MGKSPSVLNQPLASFHFQHRLPLAGISKLEPVILYQAEQQERICILDTA